MMRFTCLLAYVAVGFVALAATGCGLTPMGMAVNLAGTAVNDIDVRDKAQQLQGVSAAQCDEVLGAPMDVYRDTPPTREWRVYPVKDDVTNAFRYLVELQGDRVVAISKAQRYSDSAADVATESHFQRHCIGSSPLDCEVNIGQSPVLVVRNVKTGQLVQIYDARQIKDVQKPYYAVLRFGPDKLCSEVRCVKVAASAEVGPAEGK